MNDAAVNFSLGMFVPKVQLLLYTDYRTDWTGERREERGATGTATNVA